MFLTSLIRDRDFRKKFLYTLFMLLVAVVLGQIPVYGVSSTYMSVIFAKTNVTSFMDALSGGSLSRMAIGGFGISSYITASIMLQLLTVVFPKIETVRNDSERGRKRYEHAEFIIAMIITFVSGILVSAVFGKQGLFTKYTFLNASIAVAEWMLGSFVIIMLATKTEDYGIGNGPTLVLACNILSGLPTSVASYFISYVIGKSLKKMIIYGGGFAAGVLIVFVLAVYLQRGVLNIPLRQSRKKASAVNSEGRLPVSVSLASVLPVIYASTLVNLPYIIVTFLGITPKGNLKTLIDALTQTNWYAPTKWTHVAGLCAYIALLIFFGFYSTMLTFSPEDVANNMKRNSDVIAGVNPGKATVKYLLKRRRVITAVSLVFLAAIVVVPDAITSAAGISGLTFIGTSLIIIVAALYDTHLRIQAACIHNSRKAALFRKKKPTKEEKKEARLLKKEIKKARKEEKKELRAQIKSKKKAERKAEANV